MGSPLCKSTSGQACSPLVPISSSDVSPHIRSHVVDWVVCQHFFLSPGCPMTALATCIPTLEWNTVTSFHSRSVFSVLTYFCHSLPCCCDKTLTKSAEGGRRCLPIIALSGQEPNWRPWRVAVHWLALHVLLSLFSYTTQDHLPNIGTAYSELEPLTSIINQENSPQVCLCIRPVW